jgi:hypothetical protein
MMDWVRQRAAAAAAALVIGAMGGAGIQAQIECPEAERQVQLRIAVSALAETVRGLDRQVDLLRSELTMLREQIQAGR